MGAQRHAATRLGALGLLALVVLGGVQLASTLTSPADVIRADLIRAGDVIERLPWSSSHSDVQRAIAAAFGRSVSVDPAGFPAYARVTIAHVARDACVATLGTARRIEGEVVIVLEHYRGPSDCGDDNDMTWRLMP